MPTEPDDHLELAPRGDMDRGDLLDSPPVDLVEGDPRSERDGRENRHLGRGVRSGYVVGRIGLREAASLGVCERFGERGAALHLGEDEVRRSVDDPEDAMDVRDDERLAEHLDHRDRRADTRLEAELNFGRGSRREKLGAALGDELLVRRDDRLPRREQLEHVAARGLDPAHDFRDDTDRGVVPDRRRVGGQDAGLGAELAFLLDVAHEGAHDPQPMPGCALDVVRVLDEEPVDGRADGSVAEEADLDDVAEASQPRPPTPRGA